MKDAVTQREVEFLLHFTRVENLGSILEHGIIPRALLEQNAMQCVVNDDLRLDGCKSASCFSIAHPNYKMFYQLRQKAWNSDWVIVVCDARILWEKDCAFCVENAASNGVTQIPIANRKGVVAFDQLFAEIPGKPSREQLGIPAGCPTNPQAEVLVFDTVEPALILGVGCRTTFLRDALQVQYPGTQFVHEPGWFSARKDYQHWQ